MKTMKKILIGLSLIGVIVSVVVYKAWNKPHLDVANASSLKVNASKLYLAFLNDATLAIKTYMAKDLTVEVTGEVSSILKQQSNTAVILKTGNTGSLNCQLEGNAIDLVVGKTVTLKGICTGMGLSDADLGIAGDVYLTRCYIVK